MQSTPKILLGITALLASPAAAAPPNIVILLADDWGFTDVGAFGSEIATPNLDALAAQGVRFSNFHVAGSCSPTRAMLQTGVSHHRAGLGNMPETIPPAHRGQWGYDTVLNNRVTTIATHLKSAGYRTYFTGKWHLGHTPDKLPRAFGYDRAFALSQSGADNFENKPNKLLYTKADWTEDSQPTTLKGYSSTAIIDKTITYIDSAPGRPFLASVNFLANHIPVQAPDADIARYARRYTAGWTAIRAQRRQRAIAMGLVPPGTAMATMDTTEDWTTQTPAQKPQRARAMAAYAGMATAMDREVGRLITHLKARGQYTNTIFIFLSDNGPEALDPLHLGPRTNRWITDYHYDITPARQGRPGSFTAIGASFASAAASPLRGYKFSASEGGLRVPLIIAWPGNPGIKPGTIIPALTMVTDITPTILDLANITPQATREPITGRPLTPLLTGTANSIHPAETPIGYELSGNVVLFKGDWKLVKNLPPYGDARWHLHNIATDPGETIDHAPTQRARFEQMQADYAAYAHTNRVLPMPKGYSAPNQIQQNARATQFSARARNLAPWLLALAALTATTLALRRTRSTKN